VTSDPCWSIGPPVTVEPADPAIASTRTACFKCTQRRCFAGPAARADLAWKSRARRPLARIDANEVIDFDANRDERLRRRERTRARRCAREQQGQ
jgi:hypothetical protein